MSVRRYDAGTLRKPERLANGFLRAEGFLTRTGIFVYRNPDGSERRELRLPDEVFRADALGTFDLMPVTNEHPPEMLDATNAKQYTVGAIQGPRRDGDKVRATLMVMDADTIAAMEAGKVELSCGYTCDLEMTGGVYQGEKYDAVQRNIRGNHVAVVSVGRAGSEVRVRMDAADAVMVHAIETKRNDAMEITVNGGKYEGTPEQVAAAIEASIKAAQVEAQAKADAAEAKAVALQAKLDAADKAAENARKDAAEKFDAAVRARVELEGKARDVLGNESKFDGKTDRQVREVVIEKLAGEKMDGQPDEYVRARFDAELRLMVRASHAGARTPLPTETKTDGAERVDSNTARARMLEANRNAWKATPSGAAVKAE